jgi:hypothetical protein
MVGTLFNATYKAIASVMVLATIAARLAVLSFLMNNKIMAAKNGTNNIDNNIIVA